MEDLISVFNMDELPAKTRARVIIKLGELINYKYAANVTEPIVLELLLILDPANPKVDELKKRLALSDKAGSGK